MATSTVDGSEPALEGEFEEETIFPFFFPAGPSLLEEGVEGEGDERGHEVVGPILSGGRERGTLTREEAKEEDDLFDEGEGQGVWERDGGEEEEVGSWAGRLRRGELLAAGGEEEESDDPPSPPGLSGTTPPAGNRLRKHVKRTHKYKGTKKLSLPVAMTQYRDMLCKKRPHSMINLPIPPGDERGGKGRRNTAPAINVKRVRREGRGKGGVRKRRSSSGESAGGGGRGGGGGGAHMSPRHTPNDEKSLQKKKKKQFQIMMTLERDSKNTHDPLSPVPPLPPPQFSPPKVPPHATPSGPRSIGGYPRLHSISLPPKTAQLLRGPSDLFSELCPPSPQLQCWNQRGRDGVRSSQS